MTPANHITHGTSYRAASEPVGFSIGTDKTLRPNPLESEPQRTRLFAVLSLRAGLQSWGFSNLADAKAEVARLLGQRPEHPCMLLAWDGKQYDEWVEVRTVEVVS